MTLKLYAEILDILSDDANRPYLDHDLLSSCLNYACINHSKDIMYKCIELDSNSVYHADFKFSLYNKLFAILSAIKTKKLVVEKYSYQEYFLLVCGLLDQAKEHLFL